MPSRDDFPMMGLVESKCDGDENLPGIYAIVNVEDGKHTTYVGQTSNPIRERLVGHRVKLRSGIHFNNYLQASWNKHGEQAFRFAVLENVLGAEFLTPREQFWLDKIKECRPVYNWGKCVDCPVRGISPSDSTRKKISATRLAFSPDKKRRLATMVSKVHKGKTLSPEIIAKKKIDMLGNDRHPPPKPYPSFINRLTGEIIPSGIGLKTMCKAMKLDQSAMWKVTKGIYSQHLGWEISG